MYSLSSGFIYMRWWLLLYLAALHIALFSASRALFSAGERSLSRATLSSGLCTRILSWCLRSALAVRMGAATSPGYTGIRLRIRGMNMSKKGNHEMKKKNPETFLHLPSHGVGSLLRSEAILHRVALGIPSAVYRGRPTIHTIERK